MLRTTVMKSAFRARQLSSPFSNAVSMYNRCSPSARSPRFSTTAVSKPSISTFSGQTIILLSAASLISGFAGYFLANRHDTEAVPRKPQYGSREDCTRAVEELKKTFADDEDAVSTNADDLYSHGFSVNDHHPG